MEQDNCIYYYMLLCRQTRSVGIRHKITWMELDCLSSVERLIASTLRNATSDRPLKNIVTGYIQIIQFYKILKSLIASAIDRIK